MKKLFRVVNDPCFGTQFNEIDLCSTCWVKRSCGNLFKATKKQQAKKDKPAKKPVKLYKVREGAELRY